MFREQWKFEPKEIIKAPSRYLPTTAGKERHQKAGSYSPVDKPNNYLNGYHMNKILVSKRNDKNKRRAKNKIARRQRKV